MQTTTSVHWNKGTVARKHNERDEELCKHESHIDLYNEHGNSTHEVWMRTDLTDAYEDIFGDAIASYNGKQKRADRQMSVESYMKSIVDDTRGKRQTKKENGKAVVDEDARQGKQLSYEFTIKVGNTERKKDANGRVMYDNSGHHIRTQELPREVTRIAQKRYVETFQDANPNLRLINADYHADEGFYNRKGVWEYSTDHTHLEIVPVANGFKRGLDTQNSMNKAMAQMGFDTPDCYVLWAKQEQERLEKIVQEEYEKYCEAHPDFEKEHGSLEIVHPVNERAKQGGASKEQFALEQELDEAIHEAESIKKIYLNGCKANKEKENDLQAREYALQAQKEAQQAEYEKMMREAQIERNTALQMQQKAQEHEKDLQAQKEDVQARENMVSFREEMVQKNENIANRRKEQATQERDEAREDREQARQLLENVRALPKFDTENIYITQKSKDTGKFSQPMLYSDFKKKHEETRNRLRALKSMSSNEEIEHTGRDDWQKT